MRLRRVSPPHRPYGWVVDDSNGARLIDWEMARSVGRRLSPSGPTVSFTEAADVVADLRQHSVDAASLVAAVTGLHGASGAGGDGRAAPAAPAAEVIDRPAWIDLNLDSFRAIVGPLLDQLREDVPKALPGVEAVGRKVTATELGAMLGFLSGRVLGQFEALQSDPGRLVLVAPNVLSAERAMNVEPADFRLWVAVHEVTHRTQFESAPWLRPHLLSQIESLLGSQDMRPAELRRRVSAAVTESFRAVREQRAAPSLLDLAQSPAQREIIDSLGATMALLEGHAEYVMNDVGTAAIPTLPAIRERFQQRRASTGTLSRLLRQLIGFEAKLKQYADGSRFVGAVVAQAGMPALNRVWAGPSFLPTSEELHDPAAWTRRVVG